MSPTELLNREFDELRLRMEHEEKLLRLWVAICAGVFVAAFAFAQWAEPCLVFVFTVLSGAFFVYMSKLLTKKIRKEHEVYAAVGRTIINLMESDYSFSFRVPDKHFVGPDFAKIGSGTGYKQTIRIIRRSAWYTAFAIIVLGALSWMTPRKGNSHEGESRVIYIQNFVDGCKQ